MIEQALKKFAESNVIVENADRTAERATAEKEKVDQDAKERRLKAEKLPKYFREYYLRSHAFQLKPTWFIVFFFFYKIYNLLILGWLKFRRSIGAPKDYIDLKNLMFLKNHIQTAINTLNPGGEVYVPAGSNSISTEITCVSNMKITGSGRASIIQAAASSNQDSLFYVAEKDFVTFKDLYLDNNVANQTSGGNACIKVDGDSNNITIRNVVVNGYCASGRAGYAIYIDGGSGKTVENVIIDGLYAKDWDEQAPVVILRSNRVSITNSIFITCDRTAIDIQLITSNVTIANNIFTGIGSVANAQGNCISLNTTSTTTSEYPTLVTITGNVCHLCFGDAILMEKCFYVTCSGNVVYGNIGGAEAADDGDMGISCAGADVTITGNVVAHVGHNGISIDGTHQSPQYRRVVTGNYCLNNGQNSAAGVTTASGIKLLNSQFTLVANNFCIDTQGTHTQEYGIYSNDSNCKYNMFIGNYFHANNTANIAWQTAANQDEDLVFCNFEWTTSLQLTKMTRFQVTSQGVGENYCYFSSNCGGQDPQNVEGLALGWNKSNGNGEANLIWNSSTGASSNLIIGEFDSSTYTARLHFVKGGGIIFPDDVEFDGALNHDGSTVGFYGTTPIAQAVLATGVGATVDNVITALQNLGLVKQS